MNNQHTKVITWKQKRKKIVQCGKMATCMSVLWLTEMLMGFLCWTSGKDAGVVCGIEQ